jgi:hypothetical protein
MLFQLARLRGSPPRSRPSGFSGFAAACPGHDAEGTAPTATGDLRSPDKLKHVPQGAARKLSAVSFQLLSGMKSSRRAKNMEGQ